MILQNIEKLIQELISERAFPVLAKVDKVDTGEYTCDCVELTNEMENTQTIYTRVKIPKLWGAEKSGIWMSPSKGAVVLLNFLNGDRNYPIISAVMGSEQKEDAVKDTLIIKCGDNMIQLDDKILLKTKQASITINDKIELTNGIGSVEVDSKIGIKGAGGDLKTIIEGIADTGSQITTVGAPAPHTLNPAQIGFFKVYKTLTSQVLK